MHAKVVRCVPFDGCVLTHARMTDEFGLTNDHDPGLVATCSSGQQLCWLFRGSDIADLQSLLPKGAALPGC